MQWLEQAPEGLRLSVASPLEQVETAANDAEVVILEFDAFRDGRGFSLASVLRERGFRGRLIADGPLLPDQARHLRRTGFDGVVVGPGADLDAWRRMDGAFSAAYQPAADAERPIWSRPERAGRPAAPAPRVTAGVVDGFNSLVGPADPRTILWLALKDNQGLRPVVLSSFGAESAVLLSFVARVAPETPVLFLDTGMHFIQTLGYRDRLARHFGLKDVRIVSPHEQESAVEDPRSDLWRSDPDACCDLRKVRPLDRALKAFDLVITGRRLDQTAARADMKPFELFEDRVRVNPLLNWSHRQVEAHFQAEDLPRHPLSLNGYPSIGCWPCTRAVEANEPIREGRWSGVAKTECGIHLGRRVLPAA